MKHAFSAALCLAVLGEVAAVATPIATVTATSQSAATRMVSVTFDLSDPAIVTLGAQLSADGGSSWTDMDDVVLHVVGDVNRKLAAGSGYTALWNADLDWPGHPADGETIRPVVRCWTEDNPPLYFVMSCADTAKRWYFTDERQIPGGVTNRLYKTDYLVMRRIYAKNIVWPMGSPTGETGRTMSGTQAETQHYVKLTHDYYMAIYPCTRRQTQLLFNQSNGYSSHSVPWNPADGCAYVHFRGYRAGSSGPWDCSCSGSDAPTANSNLDRLRVATGMDFDLPTEAQWEFACRAGDGGPRPESAAVSDVAWCANDGVSAVQEVGLKAANPWGIYDMIGNVSEWCRDFFAAYESATDMSNPVVDPKGPAEASNANNNRTKRAGTFRSPESWMRSAKRTYLPQTSVQLADGNDGGGSGNVYGSGYRLVVDLD